VENIKPIQRASIGRTVIAVGVGAQANGAQCAAAIVTRVWGEPNEHGAQLVNLTIFPDYAAPLVRGSVWLCATRQHALDLVSGVTGSEQFAAHWPERS
jgi:hypothetical protein